MSTALPPKPRIIGSRRRLCIVASKYNEKYTDALVENTVHELDELLPMSHIDLVRVPGAYEIPVTVASILDRLQPVAVIALGVIIRGATAHADLIGSSIVNSLQQLAVQHRVPIINEVLLLDTEKQAYARCIGSNLNRGSEAARAAAAMIEVFSELRRTIPQEPSEK